jgi:threonine synthase
LKYYSTNRNSTIVDFKEATMRGQAPDKGLYFPETIPQFENDFIQQIDYLSDKEIAFHIIKPYVGNTIPDQELLKIVAETINFPIPLIQITENIFSLELFHGPTLAFKDIGARFMSRCLGYFLRDHDKKVTVLVATSGDTGGAVANGFYNIDGVDVVILYPSDKVSPVQEKQLTTLGKNIHTLEVKGTFDDCQQMVKQAFADKEINEKLFLTSANSINVARWLPQQFYYFFAYKQWADKRNPPIVCVPSGNFGNIASGILAMRSGLPLKHLVAACNVNDVFTKYLQTGKYQSQKAIATLSNAMDVGDPSNFVRILEIFRNDFNELKEHISSFSISDEETLTIIKEVYHQYNYLLDPHGAVGYLSLQRYLSKHRKEKGYFLETAHPTKFPEAAEKAIGEKIRIPESIENIMKKEKQSFVIPSDYSQLKNILLKD